MLVRARARVCVCVMQESTSQISRCDVDVGDFTKLCSRRWNILWVF